MLSKSLLVFGILGGLIISCASPPALIDRSEVACIGHRGDTRNNLENSMASFMAAYNNGADGTEFDITYTKDKVPLVMHDETMYQVAESRPGMSCPLNVPVNNLDYQTIADNCQLLNGEDIPRFEDVVQQFSTTNFKLLVEFKDHPDKATFDMVERYYGNDLSNVVSIISAGITLTNMYSLRSIITTKALINREIYSRDIYEIFDGMDIMEISDIFIRRLQHEGKIISLYAINTLSAMRHAFDMRVNYITVDDLSLCQAVKNES